MDTVIQGHSYKAGVIFRTCPHCGQSKPLEEFGFRRMDNGQIRNQSWCLECRAEERKQSKSKKVF